MKPEELQPLIMAMNRVHSGLNRLLLEFFWLVYLAKEYRMLAECQLLGTPGCHLCEDAEAVLMPLILERGLLLELRDIGESASSLQLYGLRIPVLRRVDTGRELDWPFDTDLALAFLS